MKHYDGIIVGLGVVLAVLMTVGCNGIHKVHDTTHANHVHPSGLKPLPITTVRGRCKTLGKSITKNASVLVERNCFRNGVTTVNIVIHNKAHKGKAAAQDSVKAVTRILGFRPKLTILFMGKLKGQLFLMAVVTGYKPNTAVALRK